MITLMKQSRSVGKVMKAIIISMALLLTTNAVQANDEDVRDLQKRVLELQRYTLDLDSRIDALERKNLWDTEPSINRLKCAVKQLQEAVQSGRSSTFCY
jgi:hypothetical protein